MKIVRESIEFRRGGDPMTSLGIGVSAKISEWLESEGIRKYAIVNGKISIYGNMEYSDIPQFIMDRIEQIFGSLDLVGSKTRALPDGLSVYGGTDLRRSMIKELPSRMLAGTFLTLAGMGDIKALPPDLKFGGAIYLNGTSVKEIPQTIEAVYHHSIEEYALNPKRKKVITIWDTPLYKELIRKGEVYQYMDWWRENKGIIIHDNPDTKWWD